MTEAWTFQKGAMWALDLKGDRLPPAVAPQIPVAFEELDQAAAGPLAEAMGLDSQDRVLQRLESGRRCFALREGERVVSYCWISQGAEWIGEMQLDFRMPPGGVYIWDCRTRPDYRRQGLYAALLNRMIHSLQQDGKSQVWIGSNLENRPSIKGFARAGFHPVIQVWFLRFFSWLCFWVRPYPAAPPALVSHAREVYSADRVLQLNSFILRRATERGNATQRSPEPAGAAEKQR